MILVTHFACCHQYKGYWRSCPLGWSYFTVMPGLNLRAGGAHAPEFTDSGKVIDATMDLWCGNTLIDSWSGSSTSRLILSGTHNVVSGQKYTLTVSGNINGVTFDGPSISKTCP